MKNGRIWPETEDVGDVVVPKFAFTAIGESGEIRWGYFQHGSVRTITFGFDAMANSTILFVHHLTRRHSIRWKRLVNGRSTISFGYK